MRYAVSALVVVSLLACAGGGRSASGPAPGGPAASPEAAVHNFMQAVADSNIAGMARYWGTAKGPAGITRQPPDYIQRLQIVHGYLKGSPYRLAAPGSAGSSDTARVVIRVDLDRVDRNGDRCTRSLPFTVLSSRKHGWLVVSIDLSQGGTPGGACQTRQAAP